MAADTQSFIQTATAHRQCETVLVGHQRSEIPCPAKIKNRQDKPCPTILALKERRANEDDYHRCESEAETESRTAFENQALFLFR
jgi:hypothetical protein